MTVVSDLDGVKIFVHLAYGFDGYRWNRKYKNGQILGINELFPYGSQS